MNQWRTDNRVEYIDTREGFIKMDWVYFMSHGMRNLGIATSEATMTMKNLQKVMGILSEG